MILREGEGDEEVVEASGRGNHGEVQREKEGVKAVEGLY